MVERTKDRIVVTGGSGFLGSHIVDALAQDHSVVVLDNMTTGRRENIGAQGSVRVVEGDVRDQGLLHDLFRGASHVVHLAAVTSVAESHLDPQKYHEVNVEGTRTVLEAASKREVPRVILASSAAVYGNDTRLPKHEDMVPSPASPYGDTKVAAERLLREYNSTSMSTVILRFFNLYGPRQRADSQYAGVIPSFASRLSSKRPPVIHGSGRQTRDFLYVGDAAQAVALALDRGSGGTAYNIGSGTGTSILEVANIMGKIVGSTMEPEYAPPRPGDILHSWADISLARKELGFKPQTSLAQGLVPTMEYLVKSAVPSPG